MLILILVIIVAVAFIYSYYHTSCYGGGLQRLLVLTQAAWFDSIKSGKKKVEIRVGKADFYSKHIGRVIKVGVPGGEKIKAKLSGVKHYESLKDLIKEEGAKTILPGATEKDALEQYTSLKDSKGGLVFDPAKIKEKGGVVALHIELI